MRRPAKTAALLVGLGVGATFGPSLGSAAAWSGVAVAALGVVLSLVGTREPEIVGDGGIDHEEAAGVPGDGTTAAATAVVRRPRSRQRQTFSDLGPHVKQILEVAEEQANNILTDARLESERIVTAARREADAHLNRAHEQTVQITGVSPNSPPIPPARTPLPDEDPSPHS